ncbi:MAG: hypothetical protein U9Q07_15005, partial [Planctomycetota bacterium]|nr:hypothetical protein [Planctomycetota bacterium]
MSEATFLPERFMPTAGPAQASPSMNDIAGSMWRHKWMIAVVFILVAAPAIAAIWILRTPQYRANAELRIRPIIPRLVFRTEDNGMIPLYDSFVNTQVSVVRSLTVLQRVLDQAEIQETQWYKDSQKSLGQRLTGNSSTPMERLRGELSVRPRRRTEITDVSFVAPSAEEAKLIVNTVLEQYKNYIEKSSDESAEALYKQLQDEYKSLEQDINGLETITAGFSKSLGTATPQELISTKRARLDQAEARLRELKQTVDELQWEINETNAVDSTELAGDIVERIQKQKYFEDVDWRKLELNVRTLRHQMANSILTAK